MWYIIFLGLGVYLSKKGLLEFKKCLTFLRSCKVTIGAVIEVKAVPDSKGRTLYQPVFMYKTESNQETQLPYPVRSSTPVYDMGEEALIAYDSSNPTNARLFSYFGIFRLTILMFAAALPMLVIGIGYFAFLILV